MLHSLLASHPPLLVRHLVENPPTHPVGDEQSLVEVLYRKVPAPIQITKDVQDSIDDMAEQTTIRNFFF